ncbi:catalase [Duganella sp. 1224]|nr:catalase [Duganella sp. 1224]
MMSEQPENLHRRTTLLQAARLSVAGTLAVSGAGAALASPAAPTADQDASAEKAIDTLEGTYGKHRGLRRNHTKGIGAQGTFIGNPKVAAPFSRSLLFSGKPIAVVARFSIAGGNPVVEDKEKSTRGLGLEFRLPDGSMHHITMLNTPMFFARMPATFIAKFAAVKPDPATGKPVPSVVKHFNDTHPDAAAQTLFLTEHNPPPSYAHSAFYGIHTFKFVNQANQVTLVRWRFVPHDGEKSLSDAEMATAPTDFLYAALSERIKKGPIKWDMLVSIGEPGDSETDPTILWPKERKEINVGTLTLTSIAPAETAASNRINFDPLVMADGILPTEDPILLFRSPSYAYSYSRRQSEG